MILGVHFDILFRHHFLQIFAVNPYILYFQALFDCCKSNQRALLDAFSFLNLKCYDKFRLVSTPLNRLNIFFASSTKKNLFGGSFLKIKFRMTALAGTFHLSGIKRYNDSNDGLDGDSKNSKVL